MEELKNKMTILFSTHVLHDAEQVCDSVIMLKDGEIKWDGSLASLKENDSTSAIQIKTAESLEQTFTDIPNLTHIDYQDSHTATLYYEETNFSTHQLLSRIVENRMTLLHFEKIQDSLEDAYMKVMNI
jgi:ABC-2 type transport system ATP-binding protein